MTTTTVIIKRHHRDQLAQLWFELMGHLGVKKAKSARHPRRRPQKFGPMMNLRIRWLWVKAARNLRLLLGSPIRPRHRRHRK